MLGRDMGVERSMSPLIRRSLDSFIGRFVDCFVIVRLNRFLSSSSYSISTETIVDSNYYTIF